MATNSTNRVSYCKNTARNSNNRLINANNMARKGMNMVLNSTNRVEMVIIVEQMVNQWQENV